MPLLCLLKDDGSIAAKWELGERTLTIGRSSAADVQIDDDGLSRRHFMVFREGDDFLVKDLNSRNGTWLEGDRAVISRVEHNDFIQAGRSRFLFAAREEGLPVRPLFRPGRGPHDTVIIPTTLNQEVANLAEW